MQVTEHKQNQCYSLKFCFKSSTIILSTNSEDANRWNKYWCSDGLESFLLWSGEMNLGINIPGLYILTIFSTHWMGGRGRPQALPQHNSCKCNFIEEEKHTRPCFIEIPWCQTGEGGIGIGTGTTAQSYLSLFSVCFFKPGKLSLP